MSPLSFPWDLSDPLIKSQKMSAKSAIFRHPEDFFAGTLSLSIEFWKTHILRDCDPPLRIKYLNWLKNGVTVREFLNPYTTGIYKNRVLNSFLPSKAFFPNNVPPKHQQWVNTEITTLLKFGVIKKWNDCPQSKICPTPLITHPLMVKEERTKNRLIYDAQFLNCFMNPPSFTMQGIPKLAQLGWANMFMTTLDHKNGYFHVPLNTNSWTYFGVYWNNMFYVYTTLCFGWSPAPFIYSTLTELIANYVRALTLALILTWIDDAMQSNSILTKHESTNTQFHSANYVCCITCMVLYKAGYFVNLPKSVFIPVQIITFLGIIIDSHQQMFFIPPIRVQKTLSLINKILDENQCTLKDLERCVGKCRSMAIAVPAAKLYTRAQYAALSKNLDHNILPHQARQKTISLTTNKSLKEELAMWQKLNTALINGASWLAPERIYATLENFDAYTDASARRWGGIFHSIKGTFKSAGVFSTSQTFQHINDKEGAALLESVINFLAKHKELARGKIMIIKVDNRVLFDIYTSGGSSKQQFLTDICKQIFWLEIQYQCKIKLSWIPSLQNEADPLTRENSQHDITLTRKAFLPVLLKWGPFRMDLMASYPTVQKDLQGRNLKFYSQYFEKQAKGTDVFAQNITRSPSDTNPDFCFPPFALISVFLQHLMRSKGWCVVILPGHQHSWSHIATFGTIEKMQISLPFEGKVFNGFHKNSFTDFTSKYQMFAVELDFRLSP